MFVDEDCVDSRSEVDDLRTRDCYSAILAHSALELQVLFVIVLLSKTLRKMKRLYREKVRENAVFTVRSQFNRIGECLECSSKKHF